MDEEKKNISSDEEQPFQPGEKGFAVVLLLFGLFFIWQSIKLYLQAPGASSYGAVPLFCSAAITVFSVAILITDRKKRSVNTDQPFKTVLRNTLSHVVSRDILVVVACAFAYCVALYLGVGFMIATPVFLWGVMTYLSGGNYLKNLFWTALCMLFIYLVFQVLFSVVLP